MSSWKYAGTCMSLKGTFMYLYFPNDEMKAVLGIDVSSNEMWWYPSCRSKTENYFAPFSCEKMSSMFGIGQINVLVILLSAW